MKKRDLEHELRRLGWWQIEGSKHDKWTNGELCTMVPRHKEINEYTAKGILRIAKQSRGKVIK